MGICSIDGCLGEHLARGWCRMHYERWRRWGDAKAEKYSPSWDDALGDNLQVGDNCWEWQGAHSPEGYGYLGYDGRSRYLHVFMYELFNGPVPEGLEIDHLCRNRGCGRPSHLEAVTHQTNILRGETLAAENAAKTHCPQGHPYAGDNLSITLGRRVCKECSRQKTRRYRERINGANSATGA